MKYRKKPIVVEAFQWFGDNRQTEDPEWIVEAIKNGKVSIDHKPDSFGEYAIPFLSIAIIDGNLEGEMVANQGDYIIRDAQGNIFACKPDIFEANYEKVEPLKTAVANITVNIDTKPIEDINKAIEEIKKEIGKNLSKLNCL